MTAQYNVLRTSRQTADVEDKTLDETATTRMILRPKLVDNPGQPDAKLKIQLVHQRKTMKGSWEDCAGEPLSTLKSGQEFKLSIDSATTLELYKHLERLYALASGGGFRYNQLTSHLVSQPGEVITAPHGRAEIIKSLLSKGYSSEVWQELVRANPDLATTLSYARIQEERKKALEEFEANLGSQRDETWWQTYFERNTWIFGYGLNYQFLNLVSTQPHYGGVDLTGKGMEKGDFLTHTAADIKFTVLLEIKKPDSQLLGKSKYRNGAWQLGDELVGGVSQLQANCEQLNIDGARTVENSERLLRENIFTVSPKGILVIGKTTQLEGNTAGRNTFERFRRSLSNPEVLTYDELYERAKFIVGHTAEVKSGTDSVPKTAPDALADDGDIPF